jgi:hypothetical protein
VRSRSHRLLAGALVAALALPVPGLAQEPASTGGGLAGGWAGWAKLANDWPGLPCRYDSGPEATPVRLELNAEAGRTAGSVAIDLPAETGSGCPALRKRYAIAEATVGPGTLSFTDSGGNEWTLSVRRNEQVLQGLLAWRQGGREEPLAEGFAGPDGRRPMTRLSGEVRLQRAEEPSGAGEGGTAPAAAPAEAVAPTPKAGAGKHAGNVAIAIGANVVGLGLLYGANKLGKGSSESGVVTCSPRTCIVGALNEPCFCEGNVLSGAPCETTATGAPINAPCDGKLVPCQAGLSCNSGLCEDRFGRCPY